MGLIEKVKEVIGFTSKRKYELKFFRVGEYRLEVKRYDKFTGKEIPYENPFFVGVVTEGTYDLRGANRDLSRIE